MSTRHIARLRPWDGAGCFAVDYMPGSVDDPRRDLIKLIKAGDAAATAVAAQLLAHALDCRTRPGSVSLVAVPGHAAVTNRTTETLCAQVATMLLGVRRVVDRSSSSTTCSLMVVLPMPAPTCCGMPAPPR